MYPRIAKNNPAANPTTTAGDRLPEVVVDKMVGR
jgi:hypothetical protein